MVVAAAQAYARGEGALAKELSDQRKAEQARCEELNKQANALRSELKAARETLDKARQNLQATTDRIKRFDHVRHIAFSGFEKAYGVTAEIVCEELSALPVRITRCIAHVVYDDALGPQLAVGLTANKQNNPEQTIIFLYIDPISIDTRELDQSYRHTIVHEAGHVLFDWVLNAQQRWLWGELHNKRLRSGERFITNYASESLREDFGECFQAYVHRRQEFHDLWLEEYTFIEGLYKELQS